ncbi:MULTISPECIES: hypothetical protein [unclassified Roseovarius]|uniref:hypothetical protein n=1 Tax=unclassified Roseovarius TaxID=2614913 RepID=UPI002740170B|nr:MULTISPECIES: hypothetical protein [unclassified Roseovarius]
MSIKTRLKRLEEKGGKGVDLIIPDTEYRGGTSDEYCTHAIATWDRGNPYRAERQEGESFPEFKSRFVGEFIADFRNQLGNSTDDNIVMSDDVRRL